VAQLGAVTTMVPDEGLTVPDTLSVVSDKLTLTVYPPAGLGALYVCNNLIVTDVPGVTVTELGGGGVLLSSQVTLGKRTSSVGAVHNKSASACCPAKTVAGGRFRVQFAPTLSDCVTVVVVEPCVPTKVMGSTPLAGNVEFPPTPAADVAVPLGQGVVIVSHM
jgi:hypothetical protein